MGRNFLGGNFPGGNFPVGSLMGGNFAGGNFPRTDNHVITSNLLGVVNSMTLKFSTVSKFPVDDLIIFH